MDTNQNSGFLNTIINTVSSGKIRLVSSLSGVNDFTDEANFIDDGYLKVKIEKHRRRYEQIKKQLEAYLQDPKTGDGDAIDSLRHEFSKQEFGLCFYSSHIPKNLSLCSRLLSRNTVDLRFNACVHALEMYFKGDEDAAYTALENALDDSEGPKCYDHYLINKTYGTLLLNHGRTGSAVFYLQKAVERKPDDMELHMMLYNIYKANGMVMETNITMEILNLIR